MNLSKITPLFGGVARRSQHEIAGLALYGLSLDRILPVVKRVCATLQAVTRGLDTGMSSGSVPV